jgi:AcrR family transcriptional regulator
MKVAVSQQQRAAPRRRQEDRRAETRARLLDATIQSLLDGGYAKTTVRRVAQLAGVSTGAQAHHYPTRMDLVAAAVERLGEQRLVDLRRAVTEVPAGQDRLRTLLDLLWADFSSPLFTVWAKVWVAAADDPELLERIKPIERRVNRFVRSWAQDAFGPYDEDDEEFVGRMRVVVSTIRGLALSRAFEPGGEAWAQRAWPAHRRELEQLLTR